MELLDQTRQTLTFIRDIISQDVLPFFDATRPTLTATDLSTILSQFLLIEQKIIDSDVLLSETVTTVQNMITNLSTSGGSGCVLKKWFYQTSTLATVSGSIPYDNTIPQITEGVQVMETFFTPTSDLSMIEIDIDISFKIGVAYGIVMTAFVDNNPNAIVTNYDYYSSGSHTKRFSVTIPNTDLLEKRFSVRVGGDGASTTFYLNYVNLFGGSAKSSISLTEYKNA